jgi:hypothetical protein
MLWSLQLALSISQKGAQELVGWLIFMRLMFSSGDLMILSVFPPRF